MPIFDLHLNLEKEARLWGGFPSIGVDFNGIGRELIAGGEYSRAKSIATEIFVTSTSSISRGLVKVCPFRGFPRLRRGIDEYLFLTFNARTNWAYEENRDIRCTLW